MFFFFFFWSVLIGVLGFLVSPALSLGHEADGKPGKLIMSYSLGLEGLSLAGLLLPVSRVSCVCSLCGEQGFSPHLLNGILRSSMPSLSRIVSSHFHSEQRTTPS